MNFEERKDIILQALKKKGKLSFQEIEALVDVAPTTIRRDLTTLEQNGALIRFHGGIKLDKGVAEFSMHKKSTMHINEKKLIGKSAAELIQPNEFIFISSGSTTFQMIEHITDTSISVITNGIPHAEALNKKNIRTFLLCGFLKEHTRSVAGSETVKLINSYHFDRAFIGANGIASNLDLLSADTFEHEIKEAAIQNSKHSYILVDASKFDTTAMYALHLRDYPNANIITEKYDEEDSQVIIAK